MGKLSHIDGLTVMIRVTGPRWGRRAAALAMQVYEAGGCPDRVCIRRYEAGGGRAERYSSGYDVLVGAATPWVLCIDADSYCVGDVSLLARGMIAHRARLGIRRSPLQTRGRDGWDERAYERLFRAADLPYRDLATTCAWCMRSADADRVLPRVGHWRRFADDHPPVSRHYHSAQAAFALACAEAGIRSEQTWWWGPEILAWPEEAAERDAGIIVHGASSQYTFPFTRRAEA